MLTVLKGGGIVVFVKNRLRETHGLIVEPFM